MKVITIKEPWATLIAEGFKEYEFRSWKTKYRGEILIHAGLGFDKDCLERFSSLNLQYQPGKIIAKAVITDCLEVTKELEDELIKQNETVYGASRNRTGYAFKLEYIQKLEKPIKIKGQLGLWNYNENI